MGAHLFVWAPFFEKGAELRVSKMQRITAEEYRRITQKRVSGKTSTNNSREKGAAFECLIDASCERYKAAGRAAIEKTPEPMKVLKNLGGGRFEAVFAKKAQVDYKGCKNGGRAIAFDAKATDNDKILQSAITPEQSSQLEAMDTLGCDCFVLVSIQDLYCRVPWRVWRDMTSIYNRKYMTKPELKEYQVSMKGLWLAFLD